MHALWLASSAPKSSSVRDVTAMARSGSPLHEAVMRTDKPKGSRRESSLIVASGLAAVLLSTAILDRSRHSQPFQSSGLAISPATNFKNRSQKTCILLSYELSKIYLMMYRKRRRFEYVLQIYAFSRRKGPGW